MKLVFNDTYAYLGDWSNYKQFEQGFYDTLLAQEKYWESQWAAEKNFMRVTIDEPTGQTLIHQTLHSIVKDMITRKDFWFPSYGVFPGYGIPGNNGFQEIFTVSLPLALEYGLFNYAKGVFKNYLDYYWMKSGNVMYRGLEMAEVGRMLTQVAMYFRFTGDAFFLDDIDKINGSVNMLLRRYENSLRRPPSDPAYGLVTGDDEADSYGTFIKGGRTEYPFYSLSAEAVRAFSDLGAVFLELGTELKRPNLTETGKTMLGLAPQMLQHLRASLDSNRFYVGEGVYCLPYAAGTKTCTMIEPESTSRISESWR